MGVLRIKREYKYLFAKKPLNLSAIFIYFGYNYTFFPHDVDIKNCQSINKIKNTMVPIYITIEIINVLDYKYLPVSSKIGLVWFGFYGISTIVGYLMPNPFYSDEQFYFKQFS